MIDSNALDDLYNKDYANTWIEYQGANQDKFRQEHIFPFLKNILAKNKSNARVLDVGCGWGAVLGFLPDNYTYTGVDPVGEFFDYVKNKYSEKSFGLVQGKLPDLPVKDNFFDAVVCSMVLHCTPDLESSIDALFNKARPNGKVVVVDFNDNAESVLRSHFLRIDEDKPNHVKGLYNLFGGVQLYSEAYFHKEAQIESVLGKHSDFSKTLLGPLFVGYEI